MKSKRQHPGRPTAPAKPGERATVSLRLTAETKTKLEAAAKTQGRPFSHEAEKRLERSFETQDLLPDVLSLVFGPRLAGILIATGLAMRDSGQDAAISNPSWLDDPTAFDHAIRAGVATLEAFRPNGDIQEKDFVITAQAWQWSEEKRLRAVKNQVDNPISIAIELLRSIKGEPTKDWFADLAPKIAALLGPSAVAKLRMPESTEAVRTWDLERAGAKPKTNKRRSFPKKLENDE